MSARHLAVLHDSPDFGGHEKAFLAWLPAVLADPEIAAVEFWIPQANAALAAALDGVAHPKLAVTRHPFAKGRGEPFRAPLRRRYGQAAAAFVAGRSADLVLMLQGRIENLATPMLWLPRRTEVVSYLPMAHSGAEMGRPRPAAAVSDAVKRIYYARPQRIIMPSHAGADQARRGGARGPIHVVENVPSAARAPLDRRAARERLGLPATGRLALFMGRFDLWQKGLDLLLRDIRAGGTDLASWRFLFVGQGEGRAMLEAALAAGAFAGEIVAWTDQPASWLAAADAVLMPSRFEGVPLIMLEALQQEIPVVASDIDVFREYLPAALLHDFRRPVDLAAALEGAVAPAARAAYAEHARATIRRLDPARSRAAFAAALLGRASTGAGAAPSPAAEVPPCSR